MAINKYSRLKIRGGSREKLSNVNPILAEREPVVETDTHRMKIGDGVTHWNDLPYISASIESIGDIYTKDILDDMFDDVNDRFLETDSLLRSYIDSKVLNSYKHKGTKNTFNQLPMTDNVAGDVWSVASDTSTPNGSLLPAGTNFVWTGSEWDSLSGAINLSGKADIGTTLDEYGITDAYTKQAVDTKTEAVRTEMNNKFSQIPRKGAGNGSVIIGDVSNIASKSFTFAAGENARATDDFATAIGNDVLVSSPYATGIGSHLIVNSENAFVTGRNNKSLVDGDLFVVGKGSYNGGGNNINRINLLRANGNGNGTLYCSGVYNTNGADYAEYFEWVDGNPDNADRRGLLVTLDGDKIRPAEDSDDYILGIISATPSVCGDVHPDDWNNKYLKDIFGELILEEVDGKMKPVLNPEYDPEMEYISREHRKEWSPVGMVGKLVVIDDGTCEVNTYAKPGTNGIVTKSEESTNIRVMKRLDDTHIVVYIR